MALVFPTFFTDKGRAVFLSIIFGIMLTKPITNISMNAKETGTSLACIAEMAANQSQAIQDQLKQSIDELSQYVKEQSEDLKRISGSIKAIPDEINRNLDRFQNAVEDTTNKLVKECQNALNINSLCTFCSEWPETPFVNIRDICTTPCDAIANVLSAQCILLHVTQVISGILDTTKPIRNEVDELLQYIAVDVQVSGSLHANVSSSKSLSSIQEEVNHDIESKARAILAVITFAKKFLSLSLFLMFFQSFWYIRSYLAKNAYDNVYITKQFVALDAQSSHPVIPLKKKEKDVYIVTSSWKLNAMELSYCKLGLFQVLLHFILCFVIFLFDYVLYYLLVTFVMYNNVNIYASGQNTLNINVDGKGPVADFYRILLKSKTLDKKHNVNLDIGACLPNPSTPSTLIIPVLLVLYMLALAFVILRGYGMRLGRKIAAYYYPEQERERLVYLHKKIRHKRVGHLKFLRQQIMSSHKESRVKDKLRFSTWVMYHCPIFGRCMKTEVRQECTSCEQQESGFSHVTLMPCKGKSGGVSCDAVYCTECLAALSGAYPICCSV